MTREPVSSRLRRSVWAVCSVFVVGFCVVTPSSLFAADLPGVVTYRGIHPLFPHAGAFCYIDVPHVHRKRPSDLRVYRVLPNDEYLFVGDPVALGYVGPTKAYFGPHPLDVGAFSSAGRVFCYIRGPHFHAQDSPPSRSFVSKAGVYWYMETLPPEFGRDSRYLWINDSGVIASYQPPTVSRADAPEGYRFPLDAQVQPTATTAAREPLSAKGPAKGAEDRTKGGIKSNAKMAPR